MSMMNALFAGSSGLSTYGSAMSVIGNNLANANTTAFKASRVTFGDVLSQAQGSTPATGLNQVGSGVRVSTVNENVEQGSFLPTASVTDLAIDGEGFFVLRDPSQGGALSDFYTRAGDFVLDVDGTLVANNGWPVQGWKMDTDGVRTGSPMDMNLSGESAIPAQPTSKATLSVNLNSDAKTHAITAFDPDDSLTFNFSSTVRVYDSIGSGHNVETQFVNIARRHAVVTENGNSVNLPSGPIAFDLTEDANVTFTLTNAADATDVITLDAYTGTVGRNTIKPADFKALISTGTMQNEAVYNLTYSPSAGRMAHLMGDDGKPEVEDNTWAWFPTLDGAAVTGGTEGKREVIEAVDDMDGRKRRTQRLTDDGAFNLSSSLTAFTPDTNTTDTITLTGGTTPITLNAKTVLAGTSYTLTPADINSLLPTGAALETGVTYTITHSLAAGGFTSGGAAENIAVDANMVNQSLTFDATLAGTLDVVLTNMDDAADVITLSGEAMTKGTNTWTPAQLAAKVTALAKTLTEGATYNVTYANVSDGAVTDAYSEKTTSLKTVDWLEGKMDYDLSEIDSTTNTVYETYTSGLLTFNSSGGLQREGTTPIGFNFSQGQAYQEVLLNFGGAVDESGDGSNDFSDFGRISTDSTTYLQYATVKATKDEDNTGVDGAVQYAAGFATTRISQDGFPAGFLEKINIDELGRVFGSFSNGQVRSMFQIKMANFANEAGLERIGANIYAETSVSGQPVEGEAGSAGFGTIASSSLEQSNADMSNEFVTMISIQRAFQANSRIITVTDTMMDELINLKR